MTAIQFVYVEIILLLSVNIFILRLYKRFLFITDSQGAKKFEVNSRSLFPRNTFDSFMLRFPIPIFSELKYDGIEDVIKKHNKLTYVYYMLSAVFLIHFWIFIL